MNSSEMNTLELIAFEQSSRILRSPVRNREMKPFGQCTRTTGSPVNGESSGLVTSQSERSRTDLTAFTSRIFGQLGELGIRSLVDMLEDGKRRPIHQPMRGAIDSMACTQVN